MANLHAHFKSTEIRVRHIRGDEELPYLAWNRNYDFDYQQSILLDEITQILPGDEIIVECTYDTEDAEGMIIGGENTFDEMCLAYFGVYPNPELSWCLSTWHANTTDDFYTQATINGYYDPNTGEYDTSMSGATEFYLDLWENTEKIRQVCLNMNMGTIGFAMEDIPRDFLEYPEPIFGDCDESGSGSSGFEWDWDSWYAILSFILLFVAITVTCVYCICTWHDKKYGPDKIGDNYGSMMMARAPSFSEQELSKTAI